ncbi:MAG: GGDEF domain-containing protein, partial [Rhodobacteraceae bacterium]|nr:GGDEF domain-containing protein [Paracoccaceae bacterium]
MTTTVDDHSLDQLMPMHLRLTADGTIVHIGPTLSRLSIMPEATKAGFWDVFDVLKPLKARASATLTGLLGTPLKLRPKGKADAPTMRGMAVELEDGGVILNLSFGIGVVDAVARYSLTQTDFPPTDLAIEMLYLFEAKSAVMDESRRLNQHLEDARSLAEEQAFTDALTGLGNRRALEVAMDRLIERGDAFSVMHLDLDHFKEVNDTFGHAAGDRALVVAAEILKGSTRKRDIVTRIGGDEFVCIIYGATAQANLKGLGERIISGLEQPIPFEGNSLNISGSVGITLVEPGAQTLADDLIAQADAALYTSKNAGR